MPNYQPSWWWYIAIFHLFLSLSCYTLLKGGAFDLEFISISVATQSSFGIITLFVPFLPSTIFSCLHFYSFCTPLQIVNSSNFLLLGDFNVDFCNPSDQVRDILLNFLYTTCAFPYSYQSFWNIVTYWPSNGCQFRAAAAMYTNSSIVHFGISLTLELKVHRATARNSRKVLFYNKGEGD